jgi:hypothetical protein
MTSNEKAALAVGIVGFIVVAFGGGVVGWQIGDALSRPNPPQIIVIRCPKHAEDI